MKEKSIFANLKKTESYDKNDCFMSDPRLGGRHGWRPEKLPMQEMWHAGEGHRHAVIAQLPSPRVAQLAEPRRDGRRELLLQEVRHLGDEPQPAQLVGLSGGKFALMEPPRSRGRCQLPVSQMRPPRPQPAYAFLSRLPGRQFPQLDEAGTIVSLLFVEGASELAEVAALRVSTGLETGG